MSAISIPNPSAFVQWQSFQQQRQETAIIRQGSFVAPLRYAPSEADPDLASGSALFSRRFAAALQSFVEELHSLGDSTYLPDDTAQPDTTPGAADALVSQFQSDLSDLTDDAAAAAEDEQDDEEGPIRHHHAYRFAAFERGDAFANNSAA